jgi:hypothetical protein
MPTLNEKEVGMRIRQGRKPRPGPKNPTVTPDVVAEARQRLRIYELMQKFDGDLRRVAEITARPVSWLREWKINGFPLRD